MFLCFLYIQAIHCYCKSIYKEWMNAYSLFLEFLPVFFLISTIFIFSARRHVSAVSAVAWCLRVSVSFCRKPVLYQTAGRIELVWAPRLRLFRFIEEIEYLVNNVIFPFVAQTADFKNFGTLTVANVVN